MRKRSTADGSRDYTKYRTISKLPQEILDNHKKPEEEIKPNPGKKKKILIGVVCILLIAILGFWYSQRIVPVRIYVDTPLNEREINENGNYEVVLGEEIEFNADVHYEGMFGKEPYATVESSVPWVASVASAIGGEKLVAEAVGNTVIEVTAGDLKHTYPIEVIDSVVEIPDFEQFCGGLVAEIEPQEIYQPTELEGNTVYVYKVFGDFDIYNTVREYIFLLEAYYEFTWLNEDEEGYVQDYRLQYQKEDSIDTDYFEPETCMAINIEPSERYIAIWSKNEMNVVIQDSEDMNAIGARAYEIDLYCPDLFVSGDGNIIWAPEGYSCSWYINGYISEDEFHHLYVESSDNTVIKVDIDNHTLQAVGEGTAVLTAYCGFLTDSIEITVYPVHREYGSTLSLSNDTINSQMSEEVSIEATMTFGEKSKYAQTVWAFSTYGQKDYFYLEKYGDWENHKMEITFYNYMEFIPEERGENAAIMVLVACPEEGYKWHENILGYKVIQIDR